MLRLGNVFGVDIFFKHFVAKTIIYKTEMIDMCELCRQSPCAAQCPNAEPLDVVECCEVCRGPIRENEEYIYGSGDAICMDCVFEMSARDVFEYFGYVRRTAERNDTDDDFYGLDDI